MIDTDGRRREPDRRDEEDERGPLISSENEEPVRPGRRFEQFEEWEKPRELKKKNTEGQRSRAGRSA